MSTLPLPGAFNFLLKHDDARKSRKKCIVIIILVIIGILILAGCAAVLVNYFFLDQEPDKSNLLFNQDEENQNSNHNDGKGNISNSNCQVVQFNDKKLTPCSFPFVTDDKKFNNCTEINIGRFWCSTKVWK